MDSLCDFFVVSGVPLQSLLFQRRILLHVYLMLLSVPSVKQCLVFKETDDSGFPVSQSSSELNEKEVKYFPEGT
jgi:hypothetical protein